MEGETEKANKVRTPTIADDARPVGALARLALISTATGALLIAVGYWPTTHIVGRQGVAALIVGVLIALVGGWAAYGPVLASLRKPGPERVNAILLSTVLRFVVTLGLATAAALSGYFPSKPLILWVAIAQLIVLAVDTVGLVRLVKHGPGGSGE